MKAKCIDVKDRLDILRARALEYELDIVVFYPRCCTGRVTTLHVGFDYHGERVLNWWPGTGRTWSFDCQKEKVADMDAVLELAQKTLDRHPGPHLRAISSGV